nr:LLM class flavin-dependent oxidoreductase [Actinomycetota bacterium]
YNTTPDAFAAARGRLTEHLRAAGKDPDRFPNAIATVFFYVTENRARAEQLIRGSLSSALNRPEGQLRQRLLVGPAGECAEKLAAYRAAGANRIFLWPVEDELRLLAAFQEQVAPLVHR